MTVRPTGEYVPEGVELVAYLVLALLACVLAGSGLNLLRWAVTR